MSPEEFKEIWNSSNSMEEACRKLNMTPLHVRKIVYIYRERGVDLKKLKKTEGGRLSAELVERLNKELLDKLLANPDRIISIWERSQSLSEAAGRLDTHRKTLLEAIEILRQKGFVLKYLE